MPCVPVRSKIVCCAVLACQHLATAADNRAALTTLLHRAFKPEYEKAAAFLLKHSSIHVYRLDCAVDVSVLGGGGGEVALHEGTAMSL